jgi:hypothetical protein
MGWKFSGPGLFSSLVQTASTSSLVANGINRSKYNSLKFSLRLKWCYFFLSLIVAVGLSLLDIHLVQYIFLYWAFVVLPLTEYWVTSTSLSVGRSLVTGFHFLVFVAVLNHNSLWNPSQIELYATLFCYYRISLTGLISTNLVLFSLLAYGTIHIVHHPEFSWPLLLHASWGHRILHLSRTRSNQANNFSHSHLLSSHSFLCRLRANLDQLVIMKRRIQLEVLPRLLLLTLQFLTFLRDNLETN